MAHEAHVGSPECLHKPWVTCRGPARAGCTTSGGGRTWLWLGRKERGAPRCRSAPHSPTQPHTASRCCQGHSPLHQVLPSREHLHKGNDVGKHACTKPPVYGTCRGNSSGASPSSRKPPGQAQGQRREQIGSFLPRGRGGGCFERPWGSYSRNHLCARRLLGSTWLPPRSAVLSVTVPAGAAAAAGSPGSHGRAPPRVTHFSE